jgi:murein DD-endopeptidase MepM/ murein hydrolase activator NlpD
MSKIVLLMAGLLLLGPVLPLLAVAVLANPAAAVSATACQADTLTVGAVPESLTAETGNGVTITLDRVQLGHAATIIQVGARTPGVTRDAMIVALVAALTESGLRMLANTTAHPDSADYPHDGDGHDHDSLGLFQMRPNTGWGSIQQLMDPEYQARAFYGGPAGPNRGAPPGLLDINGWQTMTHGQAAQLVEVSARPDRYQTWEPVAETILDALTVPPSNTDLADAAGGVPESGAVVFPLPDGTWVRTSGFGTRTHPITGVTHAHTGTDYAAPAGTPILALADGVVLQAGPLGSYGNAIIIMHTIGGEPVASLYGHMWDTGVHVAEGDRVAAGQHIGDVGSAGNSTGPHLHLEIRPGNDPSRRVDPDPWLADHAADSLGQPGVASSGCYTGVRS